MEALSNAAAERFWSKADRNGPVHPVLCSECWLWPLAKGDRYGKFWLNYKPYLAHRVAYALTHGSAPDELVVRHRCDNTRCVRPEHLELGTVADNNLDRHQRGRDARGEGHGRSKLTDEQVRTVRERFAAGGVTVLALANEHGISDTAMGRILRGRNRRAA